MPWTIQNKLIDIGEAKIDVSQLGEAPDEIRDIKIELCVNPTELEIEGDDIAVGITKATIYMNIAGYYIVPGSKYGEIIDKSKRTEQSMETVSPAKLEMTAGMKLQQDLGKGEALPNFQISANAKYTQEFKAVGKSATCQGAIVTARSGDRWEIQSQDERTPLNGTQLSNDLLCTLEKTERSNNFGVEIILGFRKSDIWIDKISIVPYFQNKNREKITKALLAKITANHSSQSEDGR